MMNTETEEITALAPLVLPPVMPRTFRELVAAGAVQNVHIESVDRGWVAHFQAGIHERVLGHERSKGPRYFKTLDGAAAVLQEWGIERWEANTHGWLPKTKQALEK